MYSTLFEFSYVIFIKESKSDQVLTFLLIILDSEIKKKENVPFNNSRILSSYACERECVCVPFWHLCLTCICEVLHMHIMFIFRACVVFFLLDKICIVCLYFVMNFQIIVYLC